MYYKIEAMSKQSNVLCCELRVGQLVIKLFLGLDLELQTQ